MRNNFATNHNTDEGWKLCQNRNEKASAMLSNCSIWYQYCVVQMELLVFDLFSFALFTEYANR